MRKEKIEKMIEKVTENVNWIEFHKQMYFNDGNESILLWEDGVITTMDENKRFQEVPQKYYVLFQADGCGNEHWYAENWCHQEYDVYGSETGNWIETDTERVLTEDEMVTECIERGTFYDEIEGWKNEIGRQVESDLK